jgi:hypothetical protein
MRQLDGARYVFVLRGFVAAHQEKQQPVASLRAVDAAARSHVNLEFRHAVLQVAMTARIAVHETINADLNARAAGTVFQGD